MTARQFVERIREHLFEPTVRSVTGALICPPGRRPTPERLQLTAFYESLDVEKRVLLEFIIRDAVHAGIFQFLCVLDGVSFVESDPVKGRFQLRFLKNGEDTLLNDSHSELLHDLFNTVDTERERIS